MGKEEYKDEYEDDDDGDGGDVVHIRGVRPGAWQHWQQQPSTGAAEGSTWAPGTDQLCFEQLYLKGGVQIFSNRVSV